MFSLLFTALGLEAALRIAYHRSMDFSMEMWKYAVQLKRPVFDPRLSFAHEPNSHGFFKGQDVKINSQGLRDYEYSLAKPAGVYRILLLGDSTTFGFRDYEYSLTKPLGVYRILLLLGDSTTLGWGVSMNETAAKILERELNAVTVPGYERFEVLNAGVGNYDTVQEVTYYQTRGRNFHPDMVILVYFINDPEPVPVENKTFLITRFYLVAYVTNRFDGVLRRLGTRPDWKAYCASLYNDDRPGFQACKAALRDLVAATREDHAKLIVALLPELHQINDSYPFTAAHQKIKDVLAPEQVPVLELIDGLRNHGPEITLWVTTLDDHPNGKANALVAAQMRDAILKDLGTSSGALKAASDPIEP